MQYRTFGRLGWQVSQIGLGAAWLGHDPKGSRSTDAFVEVVHKALDANINYIDTARYYGRSEEILGDALQGVTRDYYLATKAGPRLENADCTGDAVLSSFETSLKLLQRDRVDLLQLHEVNTVPWENIMGPGGALEALLKLKAEGAVTGIGVTGRKPEFLAKLIDTGEFDSVLSYCDYDLTTALARDALIPVAGRRSVAVILGSPLRCGGLAPGCLDRIERQPAEMQEKILRLAEAFSDSRGSLHHAALRYLWGDPDASTVLSGVASEDELEDVFMAYKEGPLGEEELAFIAQLQESTGDRSEGQSS